jgi:hypothetical protein
MCRDKVISSQETDVSHVYPWVHCIQLHSVSYISHNASFFLQESEVIVNVGPSTNV